MTCVKCGRAGNRGFDGDACKATKSCEARAAKGKPVDAPVATPFDVELPFADDDPRGVEIGPCFYEPPTFGVAAPADLTLIFGVAADPVVERALVAQLPPWLAA